MNSATQNVDNLEYDTVLVMDCPINEAEEDYGFAQEVLSSLQYIGQGFSTTVCNFGSEISVIVGYSSPHANRISQKNFLIKIYDKKGNGAIKTSARRYRTFTSISQACSYIRSRCNALRIDSGID